MPSSNSLTYFTPSLSSSNFFLFNDNVSLYELSSDNKVFVYLFILSLPARLDNLAINAILCF